jgi:hypothetical protein
LAEISWCDKLASTPGIGITLDWMFTPSVSFLEAIKPITCNWVDKNKQTFTIDHQDAFVLSLTSMDGFNYQFSSSQIYCEFRHRARFRQQSAGPPTAEMLSKPLPFTQLLPEISKRVADATRYVIASSARKLQKVGVVATTIVTAEQAPPGIGRFIGYVGRPWRTSPDAFTIDVTSKLPKRKKDDFQDRCQHTISKAENNEDLINIRLDYQRDFDIPRDLSIALLDGILQKVRADALSYFEDIGQGDRFDEEIISESD